MTGILESLGERKSVFRVVVLDIDGTIVGPDLVLSKRLRSAVASAQRAGTTVLIATGRILGSALDFSRELKTNGPLICFQGAVTADPYTGDVVRHARISPKIASETLDFLLVWRKRQLSPVPQIVIMNRGQAGLLLRFLLATRSCIPK